MTGCASTVLLSNRAVITAELAAAWERAQVRYAIIHGVDRYPDVVGRDLDILVHRDDVDRMLGLAEDIFRTENWRAVRPPSTWGKRLIAFLDSEGLELHTVTHLSWREVLLASSPDPGRHEHDLFPRDPWASFVKQILMPGFRGEFTKVQSNASSLRLDAHERELVKRQLRTLVEGSSRELADAVSEAGSEGLRSLLPQLRAAMSKRRWRTKPLSAVTSLAEKIRQRVQAVVALTGVSVRVWVAPAEAGMVASCIAAADKTIFTDFVIRVPDVRSGVSARGVVTDALRSLWLRSVTDRTALAGQRVAFHLVLREDEKNDKGGRVARRLADWINTLGSQPHANLVVGDARSIAHESTRTAIGLDADVLARRIITAAIEAFLDRHSARMT